MVRVYLVDETTRIHMPESRWGYDVLAALAARGHRLQITGEAHYPEARDADEKSRAKELIESTGL